MKLFSTILLISFLASAKTYHKLLEPDKYWDIARRYVHPSLINAAQRTISLQKKFQQSISHYYMLNLHYAGFTTDSRI
jgi:hypothetical protein